MTDYIERARKMLSEFMLKTGATAEEMDKVLSFSHGRVECIQSDDGTLANMYADGVVNSKGNADDWLRKLAVLRDPSLASIPESEPATKKETTTRNKKETDMATNAPTTQEPALSKATSKMGSSESVKAKAMHLLDDYKAGIKLNWNQLSIGLGYSKNFLHGLRNQYKHGKLSHANAMGLIKKIEAKMADSNESAVNVQQNAAENSLDVPGDGTNHPAIDAEEPALGQDASEPARAQDVVGDPAAITERNRNAMAGLLQQAMESERRVKHLARALVEDALGVGIDELQSLRPQIEMMIVAKRNGIPARVVIDASEVR